jgi:hypothetical protein
MKINEIKNYYGKIYNGEIELGYATVLINYDHDIPIIGRLYISKDDSETLTMLTYDISKNSPFILKTDYEKIYIFFKNLNMIFSIAKSSTNAFEGDIHHFVSIKRKFIEVQYLKDKKDIDIHIQYSPINFLNIYLKKFFNEVIINLFNAKNISDKYKTQFENKFKEFTYSMWLRNFDEEIENEVRYSPCHVFEFRIKNELTNEKIIDDVINIINIINRIIRLFTNQKNDFVSFSFERYYEEIPFEIDVYNNINNKDFENNFHYQIKEDIYIKLLDFTLMKFIDFNEPTRQTFNVVTHRLRVAKSKIDLSIKLALIHVSLVQMINYFYNDYIKLDNKESIAKIFDKIGLHYDDNTVNNIILLNNNRNNIFKNIKTNFVYDESYFETMNLALDLILELLGRLIGFEGELKEKFKIALSNTYKFNIRKIDRDNKLRYYSNYEKI